LLNQTLCVIYEYSDRLSDRSITATMHHNEAFKDDLAPYEVSKGTIRFPLSEPVPVKLIGRIAKFRAKGVSDRAKAKAAAPRRG
jgi:uncharacterized protein YdhG (YjbR/CyaY superfamily)